MTDCEKRSASFIKSMMNSYLKAVTQEIDQALLNHLILCTNDKVNQIQLMFKVCDSNRIPF